MHDPFGEDEIRFAFHSGKKEGGKDVSFFHEIRFTMFAQSSPERVNFQ